MILDPLKSPQEKDLNLRWETWNLTALNFGTSPLFLVGIPTFPSTTPIGLGYVAVLEPPLGMWRTSTPRKFNSKLAP